MDTFFVSASEICLFQGRKSTVENYFRLQFSQVIVQLFLVKIEKVTPALAWKILTEGGTFFYPVFKMNALMFQDKRIYPQQELKSGQYFMFGAHLFKFENEAIWKCKILGTQEIVTAYALSSGLMPVDLRLVKVLYLNKVLALEWVFDEENLKQEFYLPVFDDEYLKLRHSKGGICGPLEFGYQEFSCGEIYRHNDEIWMAKVNDKGWVELVLSPLSVVKS